ncbi:hypothetical protein OAN21_02060 [Alphaproteobacteria bacterium]|nr:hypothetical protein [Alphaproteobacteria bacterium]
MLTLLGSLLGFVGSFIPELFKYFRDKSDQSHELAILDRQVDMMKLRHSQNIEDLQMIGETEALKILYKYPQKMDVRWVDALSGSVRPLITYAFFVLYLSMKGVQIYGLWKSLPVEGWENLLMKIWHEEDQVLFATVMSFWFGQRALMRKLKRGH